MHVIGLVSDTHGLLRPALFDRFDGVERIVHAGDIGSASILDALRALAPVSAVHGNTDGPEVRAEAPATVRFDVGGLAVVVEHGHRLGSPTPAALREAHPDADIIVYGHTHRALIERAGGALVVNPGAAGPARFRARPSAAILRIDEGAAQVEIVEL